ncbi:MAG TPA: RING finger protein [Planctomycetota bacterium]|nr:RING finger protein [Planctomycetota bacterium]
MRFSCSCGQSITVPDEYAGKKGLCPGCRKVLTVPSPVEAAAGTVAAPVAVPAAGSAGAAGGTCTVCQTTIATGEAATACPECRLAYHAECWQENGGCATYGCPAAPKTVKAAAPTGAEAARQGWGDTKKCPYCGETIRAAALKCKFCNEVFATADPITTGDLRREQARKLERSTDRTKAVIYFVASMLSCGAPITAVIGGVWIFRDRRHFRAMDPTDRVMVIGGFGVSCLVSLIMIVGIIAAAAS